MGAPADVEKERSAIEGEFAVKAIYSPADMARPNEIADLIVLEEEAFGSVDVLVNNAGIQHVSPVEAFPISTCRTPVHPLGELQRPIRQD